MLANRGISGPSAVKAYLNPVLSSMADPMSLSEMERAAAAAVDAVESRHKIVVYGDYDADGLTAVALLVRFFRELGAEVGCYIPDRVSEGYGLNTGALKAIAESGCRLLITVDCGSSNRREVEYAKRLGMKVVVTDHHRIRSEDKPHCPVVNPNAEESLWGFGELSGVGVAFFFAVAVRAFLKGKGWFKERPYPDLKTYLDLVALGTIADRTVLLGQNRILVKSGLRWMGDSRWVGINALKEVAMAASQGLDSDSVAFRLAPRLNAAGRVADARLGLGLLLQDDMAKARQIALMLNAANGKRQLLERQALREAETMISTSGLLERRSLVAASQSWHRGIVGLVASRLAERYRRPSLVFSIVDDLAVGSGRSIDGFNLFGVLERLVGLMERFGGHSHAAGITIRREHLPTLAGELETLAGETLTPDMMIPKLFIDCELDFAALDQRLLNEIDVMKPFGEGNPEPVFVSKVVECLRCSSLGERYIRMTLGAKGKVMDAVASSSVCQVQAEGRLMDIVYSLERNPYAASAAAGLRLRILDARDAR